MEFLQFLIDAMSVGSLYAILALALALLFGVMGLMNFAYGELLMIGAYTVLVFQGRSWPVVIVAVLVAVTIAALLQERLAFRPLRTATPVTLLITSFALSVLLQNVALMTIGPRPVGAPLPTDLASRVLHLGELRVSVIDIVTVLVTAVLLVTVSLFLTRTLLGMQMRAAAQDFEMARLLGVRANVVIASAFGITGILAGVASLLFVAKVGNASPTMGLNPLLIAFVGTVVGGMYSLAGAALGGFSLGVTLTSLQVLLPPALVQYRLGLAFLLIIVFLLFRPRGIVAPKSLTERV